MKQTFCHFPITVRITGTLGDDQLELLARTVERAVTERIAAAERELDRLLGSHGAIVAQRLSQAAAPTARRERTGTSGHIRGIRGDERTIGKQGLENRPFRQGRDLPLPVARLRCVPQQYRKAIATWCSSLNQLPGPIWPSAR